MNESEGAARMGEINGANVSPVILMAGGRPADGGRTVEVISRAIQKFNAPNAVYIGAANGDNLPFYMFMKPLLIKAGVKDVEFVKLAKAKIDVEAAKAALSGADVIFLSGGEVEDGIKWIEKHGLAGFFRDLYKKGKLFVGMSAGTIMLGSHWVKWRTPGKDETAELFDCLGIVPAIFDTHAEDEDWIELKTALRLTGEGARGYGIPRGGIIEADGDGRLVNVEKKYLTFVYNGGAYDVI